jgi:chromosome segregation ATPase
MDYLVLQLWLCLFIAFLLGVTLAWLLRGGCKKKIANIVNDWSQRFKVIEEERDSFAAKAEDRSRLEHENKSLLGRLRSMENGANLASSVLNENKARLDEADYKLSEVQSLLEQRDSEIEALQEQLNKAAEVKDNAGNKVFSTSDTEAGLNIELKPKIEELEGLTKDYQSAREEVDVMHSRLNDSEKANRELSDNKQEIEKALSDAEKLNIEHKKKNSEMRSQLEQAEKKNQDLRNELDDLVEKLAKANKKSAHDAKRIEEITGLYNQNIADSRAFKAQIMQSGNNLRADLSNKKVQCENLKKDLQSIKEDAKASAEQVVAMQDLLEVQEKRNDELLATKQQLQIALSAAEALAAKNREKIVEYEAKLEQLKNKLEADKEKKQADTDEIKMMQDLLAIYEKGNQELSEKESQLQKSLSELEAQTIESKEKEKSALDEIEIMQALLDAYEKGNQDLVKKEEGLQQAVSISGETVTKYKNADKASKEKHEGGLIIANKSPKTELSSNHYDIEEIDGINEEFAKCLRKIGIHTTMDLLEKCQDETYAKHIARAMNQNEKTVKTWLGMADLLRIDAIDGQYARLLYLSGIHSSAELAASDANEVKSKIKNVIKNQHYARKVPTRKMTSKWIVSAKKLLE